MAESMERSYEEQFTAFIDFLGFSEVSTGTDDTTRLKVLELLVGLSALRGEFDLQSTNEDNRKTSQIKPAVSTFSDHIVISYPLRPIYAGIFPDEHISAFLILGHFNQLLTRIAAAALRIGFLVRGGATIGKLYHARGVVFGEALVDAFRIESRTSIYPRVVLSSQIASRPKWVENQPEVVRDSDGLYHVDYFKMLLLRAAPPGSTHQTAVKAWLDDAVAVIRRNLAEHEREGKLNELAKWAWFAREFRAGVERLNPELLKSLGVAPDSIPSYK